MGFVQFAACLKAVFSASELHTHTPTKSTVIKRGNFGQLQKFTPLEKKRVFFARKSFKKYNSASSFSICVSFLGAFVSFSHCSPRGERELFKVEAQKI
jgi:hypothetical protein